MALAGHRHVRTARGSRTLHKRPPKPTSLTVLCWYRVRFVECNVGGTNAVSCFRGVSCHLPSMGLSACLGITLVQRYVRCVQMSGIRCHVTRVMLADALLMSLCVAVKDHV